MANESVKAVTTEYQVIPCDIRTPQQMEEAGLRYDAGKIRYDLIPADALHALAEVYTVGANKYAPRNWEKGMSWGRCFGSLMRHCWAFWRGKDIDKETGCHHMALAAWNCMTLFCYSTRRIGTDDRQFF